MYGRSSMGVLLEWGFIEMSDDIELENRLDDSLSGQSQDERLLQSAADTLRGYACELILSHTLENGEWPDGEEATKAHHDHMMALAKGLDELRANRQGFLVGSAPTAPAVQGEPVAWRNLKVEKPADGQDCITKMKHGTIQGTYDSEDDAFSGYYWRTMEWYATHWVPAEEAIYAAHRKQEPSHRKQGGGEWVKCDERLPTETDADFSGNVTWWTNPYSDLRPEGWVPEVMPWNPKYWEGGCFDKLPEDLYPNTTHWKPTGLTRPQPPKSKEGE